MKITIDKSPLPNKWIKDYRGQKFHRLTVVSFARIRPRGGAVWNCICECGAQTTATVSDLRSGHTKSCGCLSAERMRAMRTTHGRSDTPEYNIWQGMLSRCYNPHSKIYRHYGGRGIKVCERWHTSFEKFFADMGKRPSRRHSVERINNNADYSPQNCQWATRVKQANNTRQNHYATYLGKTQSIADWARELNIPYHRLRARILRGVSIERAFTHQILIRDYSKH